MLTTNISSNIGYYQAHPFHLVKPSPWPIYTTFAFFGVLFNLVMLSHNYCNMHSILLLNIITLIYVSLLWGSDIIAEATYLGEHTTKISEGLYMGYLLFLLTELMVFVGVFWGYFHSALAPTIELGELWPPMAMEAMQATDLPLLNTLMLLISGATMTYSHHGLLTKNWYSAFYGLLFTVMLGMLFMFCQMMEYTYCTYTITDSVYGSAFFFLTGLHGLHLMGGTFFLMYSLYRIYTLQLTNTQHMGYETTILLWHFLDVAWLFVYIVCYYWGT